MATSVTDSTIRPAQIDFKLRTITAPKYKVMRIPLNNLPSSTVTVAPTASTMLEFKCPTLVYNLARSYVGYSTNVPAVAAAVSWTFEDVFDLGSSITFGAAGGNNLVDLQYANNYSKVARKLNTELEDYLGNDNMSGLYKSNELFEDNLVPGGSAFGTAQYAKGVPGASAYSASENYIENRYVQAGLALGVPAVNTENIQYRRYPLGAFYGTLLGVDRDFYSPQEQYLRINCGTGDKAAFTGTDVAVPALGAASVAAGVTFNNIYLYLAVEQNMDIVQSMHDQYRIGKLAYRIPYTTAFKNTGGAANGQTNIQIQLSQQYGKRLKKIIHTVFNPQEKFNTAYDCDNYNGVKVLNYQTFVDSIPVQDRVLSCLAPAGGILNNDDWLENKKHMEKRSMILSKEHYQLNWFHIDQWYEPFDNKDSSIPEVNIDEGLRMDTPHTWLFSCTAGATAGLMHYSFAQFSRDILITDNGPIFV
jgi:hypothetical protein